MRSVALREQWERDAGAAAGETRLELAHLFAEDRGGSRRVRVVSPPNRARVATPGRPIATRKTLGLATGGGASPAGARPNG
jgi:hypothetical protein